MKEPKKIKKALNKKQIRSIQNEANLLAETLLLKKRFQNIVNQIALEEKLAKKNVWRRILIWISTKLLK